MLTEAIYSKAMEAEQCKKIEQLLSKLGDVHGTVLDIGSGPGFLERYIDCIALDSSLKHLKEFEGNRILGDGNSLPFKSGGADWIFCMDTIHLLSLEFWKELKRVLKPEGKAVISIFSSRLEKLKPTGFDIVKEFEVSGEKERDIVVVLEENRRLLQH
ncbi:MAG: class I SAM-dependent methyltransferase [Candidatus Aenigmarchaeota archaeon]|nr:class I SAM-dependent methyltransferase [Candidatus Aenigmarchaeota archaeon]